MLPAFWLDLDANGYQLGDSMIVIGAGNVAMDVARTALRRLSSLSA